MGERRGGFLQAVAMGEWLECRRRSDGVVAVVVVVVGQGLASEMGSLGCLKCRGKVL
jgi:hypothetical protein